MTPNAKVEAISMGLSGRVADYLELSKPRITILVLITVLVGGLAGSPTGKVSWALVHAMFGTLLIGAGASALNHVFEVDRDRQMRRTARRPIPAGRLSVREGLVYALIMSAAGATYLACFTPLATTLVACLSLVLYAFVYTPLKTKTNLNTALGAIPGALPIWIGWFAVGAPLNAVAISLFLIVFLWQFPHFLAIAWLCRDDYRRAGVQMLPTTELGEKTIGLQAVSHTLALLAVSLAPTVWGLTGRVYFVAALLLGLQLLVYSGLFFWKRSDSSARQLLYASLVYLPSLLGILVFDLQLIREI